MRGKTTAADLEEFNLEDRMCREISSFLWRLVQFSHRNNPEALSGVRWVTEMQKPYVLFRDRI